MEFENFAYNYDLSNLNKQEKVGLVYYFLDKIEGKNKITIKEVKKLIKNSRITVPEKSVSGLTNYLENNDVLTRVESGVYRLTMKGLKEYNSLVEKEIPELVQPSENFIEEHLTSSPFYKRLIGDINLCNETGVREAVTVLCRKLLENLLIDILRKEYGKQEITLYFNTSESRFRNFSKLISNFNQMMGDFKPYSGGVKQSLIDKLNSIRERGNSDAHSIEIQISDRELEEFRKKVNQVATILFDVRSKIQ